MSPKRQGDEYEEGEEDEEMDEDEQQWQGTADDFNPTPPEQYCQPQQGSLYPGGPAYRPQNQRTTTQRQVQQLIRSHDSQLRSLDEWSAHTSQIPQDSQLAT